MNKSRKHRLTQRREATLYADGDVIVLATGRTHSISRDEFDLKGRISFAPLSAANGWLRAGANPLEGLWNF